MQIYCVYIICIFALCKITVKYKYKVNNDNNYKILVYFGYTEALSLSFIVISAYRTF